MTETGYRTVSQEGVDEFTEKRSRFIGAICPVSSETEAQAFIAARKKQFWDARHNVYAYILERGALCRFSDDGEPQGTAGVPVLNVLQNEQLTGCVVVVTRYFGGILLGGGGLVRAYSHAAALAVAAGKIVEMRPCLTAEIRCDYARYGLVTPLLPGCGATVRGTDFAEAVTVQVQLPEENRKLLEKALADASAGQLRLVVTGRVFSVCGA